MSPGHLKFRTPLFVSLLLTGYRDDTDSPIAPKGVESLKYQIQILLLIKQRKKQKFNGMTQDLGPFRSCNKCAWVHTIHLVPICTCTYRMENNSISIVVFSLKMSVCARRVRTCKICAIPGRAWTYHKEDVSGTLCCAGTRTRGPLSAIASPLYHL